MSQDNKKEIERCFHVLDKIINDNSIPKNIRRAAKNAKTEMQSDEDLTVRATNAITELNEVNEDPNIPVHARTEIWNAISILEGLTVDN
ncbi:hypothetical protein AMET1_1074 [Methanonatronarchaeum thermophilum]|uniref:UPF0147 protein AMET1_1074 n=1 Tax=Methanonatronarchaeum thermophilum TaxID=1927129 RepID=A0A1Y3GA99_9EURY|nr:UPF0147 family protein [Methanonatronarchaeum thermophilum]OUJ18170.1 hypothetical protein AMET1_1074 [Methanonatronarchaeum thermophilum]